MLLIGVVGKGADATAYVLEEVYKQHKTTKWWAAKLSEWTNRFRGMRIILYADPSQPHTIEEYRQSAGIRLPHDKVDNAVDDGIASVAARFMVQERAGSESVSHLYIDPKCSGLLRELGLYRYKPDTKEADKFQDTPEKRNDDACDALRYAIHNHLGPTHSAIRRTSSIEERQ